MNEARSRLSVELETAALRAVRVTYSDLSSTFFGDRLRRPVIELSDTTARLGRWMRESRRLELSRSLLVAHGWGVLVEVLKHEMAHQFVDEVVGAVDEAAHGPTFRKVCADRGIDARPAGIPEKTEHAARAPILERIAKLLALAESSNEHEAHAAMKAAQRLMLKHNVEEVTRGASGAYGYRHLGKPSGRVTEAERVLANILSEHFFVDSIWVPVWRPSEGKRGSVLEVCGRAENLEMAEYVYAFLTQTAARLWTEHRKKHGIRSNRDRRAFLSGVMSGFRGKLAEQARAHATEGLVWVGDAEVARLFKQRHPHVRWTRHVTTRGSAAHAEGAAAGRSIVLHRGVKGSASGAVRMLPGRR